MSKNKIICIGSATKDIFLLSNNAFLVDNKKNLNAQRLMAFELGAKVYLKNYHEEVGGSAVNTSIGLKELGTVPFVFSRISNSSVGTWINKKIAKKKIKKNYLQKNGGIESEVSNILSDETLGDHVIFRAGDSVEKFDLEKALKRYHEKVDLVYIASQKSNWENKLKIAISFTKKRNIPLAMNPSSFQIETQSHKLSKYLKDIDVLFLNRDESIELIKNAFGEVKDDPIFLGKKIQSMGVKIVNLTDGENGAYCFFEKEIFYAKALNKKYVRDTVGAGDAFSSGFLAAFVKFKNIERSFLWGVLNSRAVIQKIGASNGLLNESKILKQEKEFKKNIQKIKN